MKAQSDISTITPSSPLYPRLLRESIGHPLKLWLRGNPKLLTNPLLFAVVGSRRTTSYTREVAQRLLPPLVKSGLTLVSGMALGVDSFAHKACLDLGRPTIAVLGCGVDDASLYPRNHVKLAHDILKSGGLLVSEYPPGTRARPEYFPARNRIVAGLCPGVLIIQAALKSGSLITARLALDTNRDVCAVPGPITDPLCEGTNWLLKQGATPVTEAADILHLYELEDKQISLPLPSTLSDAQTKIIKVLSGEPIHVDDLVQRLSLPTSTVSAELLELELQGHVTHIGSMRYIRK